MSNRLKRAQDLSCALFRLSTPFDYALRLGSGQAHGKLHPHRPEGPQQIAELQVLNVSTLLGWLGEQPAGCDLNQLVAASRPTPTGVSHQTWNSHTSITPLTAFPFLCYTTSNNSPGADELLSYSKRRSLPCQTRSNYHCCGTVGTGAN
jgi:hypothetical protein